MKKTVSVSIRLDVEIFEAYESQAKQLGIPPRTYIKDILTNNYQSIAISTQIGNIERILSNFEAMLDQQMNALNEAGSLPPKMFDDIALMQMMLIKIMMNNNVSKADMGELHNRALKHSNEYYKGITNE